MWGKIMLDLNDLKVKIRMNKYVKIKITEKI